MGWLGSRLKSFTGKVAGESPIKFTFVPSIKSNKFLDVEGKLEPDGCYLELYLESLRLERARRFTTCFDGVVYSMVTLTREGEERARLIAVSKPNKLAELDQKGIGRVITVSKQMMAPTAYRGGSVSLELGLFSVKRGNLLSPIIEYVAKVSETAGISSVKAMRPFIPLVVDGIDLIAGAGQDTVLEVGLDKDFKLEKGCVSAIIACESSFIDKNKLTLNPDGNLLYDEKPLKYGYACFSLRVVQQKADFGEIPELKERYAAITSAIRSNNLKGARDALTAFRLCTIASPDLISDDARRLVSKAQEKVREAFGPNADVEGVERGCDETLSDIGLYD